MSGPSCKIYFNDENEYFEITKIAAMHDMQLPTFVRNATIAACNQYIAAMEAAKPQGEENVEASESNGSEAPQEPGTTEEVSETVTDGTTAD